MTLKIEVDRSICVGHAMCAAKVPDLYPLDEDGFSIADGGIVPEGREKDAKLGARYCPERAIKVVEG